MKKDPSNHGTSGRPFPLAAQTKAQRDEDDFMHAHGGLGSRIIYLIVEALSSNQHAKERRAQKTRNNPPVDTPKKSEK